ncbi:MAG TPA: L,D-transpeptidase [bacterium]|nr:L,D-transpeptidase [bacterium]HQG45656.1 L,D-transpeptidase [bacterium]HQI50003.1 L,D-transpeptidase [bacterium]HQJ63806.1 L,D-transpeptidase [bacterium]
MKRSVRRDFRPQPKTEDKTQPRIEFDDFDPEKTEKKLGLALFFGLFFGLLAAFFVFLYAPNLRDLLFRLAPRENSVRVDSSADPKLYERELLALAKSVQAKQKRIDALIPKEPWLIIDTSGNQIFLMQDKTLLHKGVCSTGSYVLLRAGRNKQWIFRTPRGQFRVLNKMRRPVWYMPDWAFVEEGRPIPPRDSPLRYESGVLGEYGLALGQGYLIHGTLYKRFLGMPVTHGCVRLGDEDLEVVAKNMDTGSKVFIY